ncbi:MAG: hypothetical protein C7B45_14080 [Sulfobacillus acidophilus]|uniref:Uncharacterized protein n=1 Tax=Sulfobacillus acidophilus TaxID=53633 RepID=A0A2T2WEI7_9FIRM|nr:MAG: hypothetical protein C7B45_14080 [Sulfobacillus acidophilus]
MANSAEAIRNIKALIRRLQAGVPLSDPRLHSLVYKAYARGDFYERVEKFLRGSVGVKLDDTDGGGD